MTRKALKDFTLSDGTFIPAGTFISAASYATHHDTEFYKDPDVFNPWRFSEMRDEEGEGIKHQMVSTSSEFISFGHGKHAWYATFFRDINSWLILGVPSQSRTVLCCK